jgi:hypothetical protein
MMKHVVGAAVSAVALALSAGLVDAQQQMITGRLLEDGSNRPVEAATILLTAANGRMLDRTAKTTKFGTFTMRVEPGRYRLRVTRIGYQPVDSDILEVSYDNNVNVNYILTPVSLRLSRVEVVAKPGLETGEIGMAKRQALNTGGVFLYRDDFKELINQPVWEIVGRVEGLRPRTDGSIESLEGHRCLQFLLNRLPIREVPMQYVDIATLNGQTFASLYEMLPDGLDIMGIEVYRSFKEVPEELKMDAWPGSVNDRGVTPPRVAGTVRVTRDVSLACGLVLFWTSAAWK